MNALWSNVSSRWLALLAPWAVLLGGLTTTVWLTVSASREMRGRDQERFQQEASQLVALLDTRLRTYGQALMGLRDWYADQEKMSAAIWTNRIYTFHAPAHYPGLYNLGFVEFVRDIDVSPNSPKLEAHLKAMRERLGPEYRLTLPPGGVEGHSWYHMPVTWHSYGQWRKEPVRPYRHYGMDLNQNPDLWATMNWALGQDVPALSGRQHLDPDALATTGLMIFLPVYQPGINRQEVPALSEFEINGSPTPQLRAELTGVRRYQLFLRGLIFGGIDIRAFLRHHLETNAPAVTFALYGSANQLPASSPEQLLFDNRLQARHLTPAPASSTRPATNSPAPPRLGTTRELELYGRVLSFVMEAGPGFNSAVDRRALGLAAGFGVAATLLLSGFIAYQSRAHRKEQEISAALRQSEARLQSLLYDRERISRDLHDGTIQSLYAIGLGLGQLRRMLSPAPAPVRERLEAGLTELDRVVAELRGYLMALDPGVSPAQSAAAALAELAARMRQTTATELRFTAETGAGDGWPPAAVLDLLQVAREGISNALRHGQATAVELALRRGEPHGVILTITDDGNGFEPAARRGPGRGLANMERRAKAWNGGLLVESSPGKPTRLTIVFAPNVH